MTKNRKVYRPQPGPQFEFLRTKASVALFGGGAGSGKTYGILLESLWHHDRPGFTCAIFRKNAVQLRSPGGLWQNSQEMFREFGGIPKETTLEWNFPSGAHYKFSHIDHEKDIYGWQGSQIALCVAKGTPILMWDGSYKNIEDIKEGDLIKTLKGQKKVNKIFPPKFKKCISAKTYNSKGEFVSEQIHPLDHKFLSFFGWTSWDDLKLLCEKSLQPILQNDQSRCFSPNSQKFETHQPFVSQNIQGEEHILKQDQLFSDNSFCVEKIVFSKDDQNYFSKSCGEYLKNQQPVELSVPVALLLPDPQSKNYENVLLNEHTEDVIKSLLHNPNKLRLWSCHNQIFQALHRLLELIKCGVCRNNLNNPFVQEIELFLKSYKFSLFHIYLDDRLSLDDQFYDNFCLLLHAIHYALFYLKQEDSEGNCSTCSGQYGGQLHLLLDNVRSYLQQLNDAAVQFSLSLCNLDAKDKSQVYNRFYHIEYDHPYKNVVDKACYPVEFGTCILTPCGDYDVYDISVEEDNHYITISGLINKNCVFDELTHFSKSQFFYMLSRNRSTCGIKPYVRATCNPDADSWVRGLVDWYVDEQTGLAIPERSGVIRWFIVRDDEIIWADSEEELKEKYADCLPKSFTFISASIFDNKKLLEIDPGYLANLHALPYVERERLLNGNWNVKPSSGMYFKTSYFEVLDAIPKTIKKIRYWDRASTKKTETNDPDATVGIKLEKGTDGVFYVTDMVRIFESPLGVEQTIKNTASRDTKECHIYLEQDPGQAGKMELDYLTRSLAGYVVKSNKVSQDKVTRALPVSSQCEAGNVKVLRGTWNDTFFRELENFPDGKHDDIVDSFSGAFNMMNNAGYSLENLSRW